MFDIGVVGRTVWDNWQIGNHILQSGNVDYFGGPGANTSVALANYGLNTCFATRFGKDKYSCLYHQYLEKCMDLSFSIITDTPLPIANITPNKSFYWENEDAGFFNQSILDIESMAEKCSAMFFVEPNMDLKSIRLPPRRYLSPQLALSFYPEQIKKIIDVLWDAVFFNHKEKEQFEHIVGDSILNLSKIYTDTYWIITYGSEPTQVISNGKINHYPVSKATGNFAVGCGDIFAASYCMADMSGLEMEKVIQFGHKAASKVLRQIGCQLTKEMQSEVLLNIYG